jgi:hypothetical protein
MSAASQIYRPPLLYNGQRLDREEFYRRVEEWIAQGKNPRGIERLEGVVYMPASIRFDQHSAPQGMILAWLGVYSAATPGTQSGGNATTKLDQQNDPEGDAVLLIRQESGGQSRIDRRGYITGSPELVVEITGSSSHKDLEVKLEVYRRNGVREYIVWDTIAEELYWFVLENGEYLRLEPDAGGTLRSPVFPGLWLDVGALLDGNLQRVLEVVQQGVAAPEHLEFVARLQRTS